MTTHTLPLRRQPHLPPPRTEPIRGRFRADAGYSPLEVLASLFLIGILIGFVLIRFLGWRDTANDRDAQTSVREAALVAESVYADDGAYVEAVIFADPDLNGVGFGMVGDDAVDIGEHTEAILFLPSETGDHMGAVLTPGGPIQFCNFGDTAPAAYDDTPVECYAGEDPSGLATGGGGGGVPVAAGPSFAGVANGTQINGLVDANGYTWSGFTNIVVNSELAGSPLFTNSIATVDSGGAGTMTLSVDVRLNPSGSQFAGDRIVLTDTTATNWASSGNYVGLSVAGYGVAPLANTAAGGALAGPATANFWLNPGDYGTITIDLSGDTVTWTLENQTTSSTFSGSYSHPGVGDHTYSVAGLQVSDLQYELVDLG